MSRVGDGGGGDAAAELAALRAALQEERAARIAAEKQLDLERRAMEPRIEEVRRKLEKEIALKMGERESRGPGFFPRGTKPRPAGGREEDAADEPSREVHLRYLDEFLGTLTCGDILLESRVFAVPNASKEVTETMATFAAVRGHLMQPHGARSLCLASFAAALMALLFCQARSIGETLTRRSLWWVTEAHRVARASLRCARPGAPTASIHSFASTGRGRRSSATLAVTGR